MKLKPLLLSILFCLPLSFEVATRAEDTQVERYKTSNNSKEKIQQDLEKKLQNSYKEISAGNFKKAEEILLKALAISKKEYGENHIDTAIVMRELANTYRGQKRFEDAEELLLLTLKILKATDNLDSLLESYVLTDMSFVYSERRDFKKAELLLLRSLEIKENSKTAKQENIATVLNHLATNYSDQFLFEKAEPLYLRSLKIREEKYGIKHPRVADTLNEMSIMYLRKGLTKKAEHLLLKAIEIKENTLGKDHFRVGALYSNLSAHYSRRRMYNESIKALEKSSKIFEKIYGKENYYVHRNQHRFGYKLIRQGLFHEGEKTLLKILKEKEKKYGMYHKNLAYDLINLIGIYNTYGLLEKNKKLINRASIIANKFDDDSDFKIDFRRDKGAFYKDLGLKLGNPKYLDLAESVMKENLEVVNKKHGKDSHASAKIKSDLSIFYISTKSFSKASKYLQESLKFHRQNFGENDLRTIGQENIYGRYLQEQGLFKEAHKYFKNAYNKYKKSDENSNQNDLISKTIRANLGLNYLYQNKYKKGHSVLEPLLREQILNTQINSSQIIKSDRRNFKDKQLYFFDYIFSYIFKSKPLLELAFLYKINSHGLLEELAKREELIELSKKEHKNLLQDLYVLAKQISSINLSKDKRLILQKEKELLEKTLYGLIPEIKPQIVEIGSVAKTIPINGLLISYHQIPKVDINDLRYEGEEFIAFILQPNNNIEVIDLGSATTIEEKVKKALKATENNYADQQQLWDEVSQLVITPLAKQLEGKDQIFISPDAELNRVPFAALKYPNTNQFLGESKKIRLLTTGRELLELANNSTKNNQKPLVVANPSFDLDSAPITSSETLIASQKRSGDLLSRKWKVLPGTEKEGKAIAQITDAKLLTQKQATAIAIQKANTPQIFHIASHAYYLPPEENEIENPLLRSGIVLAGANNPESNEQDDGYLTALEVTKLDLKGTQMVVVSGCESGKGDIQSGEGVYGLKRAIAVAGARSSLLSLWKVDDAATAAFMESFYQKLKDGQGRADALLETQKDFRGKKITSEDPLMDWSDPYYWAAFQLSGDWTPIEGL